MLVFGALVLGGERIIKLFGVGLGGAVLLDAAIVRSVLVPAVMLMLGDLNWKLPAFLERILPRVNIEGCRAAHAGARRAPARAASRAGGRRVAHAGAIPL